MPASETETVKMTDVRCKGRLMKTFPESGKRMATCNALLTKVAHGRGQTQCWKCNHMTEWEVPKS